MSPCLETGFTAVKLFTSGHGSIFLFPTLSGEGGFEVVEKTSQKGVRLLSTN